MKVILNVAGSLVVLACTYSLSAQQQSMGDEGTRSFEWRAVSLDFLKRHSPGEDPSRGFIPDVHVDGVEGTLRIPFARPTTRENYTGPPVMTFFRPAADLDQPPTILARNSIPPDLDRALLFFWPNRGRGDSPQYRLVGLPDAFPRADKRMIHLINFSSREFFVGVEDQRIRLQPLAPVLVECRDDPSDRSEFIIFRGPEGDIPARRLISTSFRIDQGELVTTLILPNPGTSAPSVQVFSDRFRQVVESK